MCVENESHCIKWNRAHKGLEREGGRGARGFLPPSDFGFLKTFMFLNGALEVYNCSIRKLVYICMLHKHNFLGYKMRCLSHSKVTRFELPTPASRFSPTPIRAHFVTYSI